MAVVAVDTQRCVAYRIGIYGPGLESDNDGNRRGNTLYDNEFRISILPRTVYYARSADKS